MKIFKVEVPDLPGRDEKLNPEDGKECCVSVAITKEQVITFNNEGIDVIKMTENILSQETAQSIAKWISKSIFNQRVHEVSKEELRKSIKLISEFGEGFILTNLHVATLIESTWGNIVKKETINNIISTFGMIYSLGKIGNYKLYVDPNLRYSDNKLAIVTNNFWNYKESNPDIKVITEGAGAPKLVAKTKVIVEDPESKVFSVNNLKL